MLKILNATCPGLPPVILAQFALKMCVAARNCQKSIKPYLSIQGHPRSLLSMPIKSQFMTSY